MSERKNPDRDNLVRRIVLAVVGMAIAGIAVGFFKRAFFGVDPFQCFCNGMNQVVPIGFGTLYMLINAVLLVIDFFLDRHYIGISTFINLFLVGYAASRHILSQSDDRDYTLTTLVCGLIFAEIAWLCHSWSIIYTFGDTGIRIPQLAIILTIFAFVYNYTRQAMIKHQDDFRFKHIIGPVIFGFVLISIIVIWFSNPIFNI